MTPPFPWEGGALRLSGLGTRLSLVKSHQPTASVRPPPLRRHGFGGNHGVRDRGSGATWPTGYALAVNISRRHMTKGQQAIVVARAVFESNTELSRAEREMKAKQYGISRCYMV